MVIGSSSTDLLDTYTLGGFTPIPLSDSEAVRFEGNLTDLASLYFEEKFWA
jgi:hypothetical protein